MFHRTLTLAKSDPELWEAITAENRRQDRFENEGYKTHLRHGGSAMHTTPRLTCKHTRTTATRELPSMIYTDGGLSDCLQR